MILCSKCGQLVEESKDVCPYCGQTLTNNGSTDDVSTNNDIVLLTGQKMSKEESLKEEFVFENLRQEEKVHNNKAEKIDISNPFLNSTRKYSATRRNEDKIIEDLKEVAAEEVVEKFEEHEEAKIDAENTVLDIETIPAVVKKQMAIEEEKPKKEKKTKAKKRKKPKYDKAIVKNVRSTMKEQPKTVKIKNQPKGATISTKAIDAFRLSPAIKRRLTKKEKRRIFISTVIAMLLLVVSVIYLLFYTVYGTFETPVENYYRGLNSINTEQIVGVYPKCLSTNEDFITMIEQYILPMRNYPAARFRYEIVKKIELNEEKLDYQQIQYDLFCGIAEEKIEKAYSLKVNHYYRENSLAEETDNEIEIIVGKINEKWYILD